METLPQYLYTRPEGERTLFPFKRGFLNPGETETVIATAEELAKVQTEHANPWLYERHCQREGLDAPRYIPAKQLAPDMLIYGHWQTLYGEQYKVARHGIRTNGKGRVIDTMTKGAQTKRAKANNDIQARNDAGWLAYVRGAMQAGRVLTYNETKSYVQTVATIEGRDKAEAELTRLGWVKNGEGHWIDPRQADNGGQ